MADLVASQLALKHAKSRKSWKLSPPKTAWKSWCSFLAREIEILELEKKNKYQGAQADGGHPKEYYLREQMKAIQKELGEKDERTTEADEYREKIAEANLPEEVEKKALKEAERLEKCCRLQLKGCHQDILGLAVGVTLGMLQTEDRLDLPVAKYSRCRPLWPDKG